jgi:hypothetical protein
MPGPYAPAAFPDRRSPERRGWRRQPLARDNDGFVVVVGQHDGPSSW